MRTGTFSATAREGGAVFEKGRGRGIGMAGDWIKMEVCTTEKSEVLAITARMGWDDADLTVGKLFRVWRWFDQQTVNGNAVGVTSALLDRIIGVTGFCDAMESVGWLTIGGSGLSLPNFDHHNGASAKSRAQTAKRVANHKKNGKGNAKGNGVSVTESARGALPREEKRREDITSPNGEGGEPPKVTKPEEIIFGYGVPLLIGAGAAEKQARSFLGGLRKNHGDQAVVDALRDCLKAKPLQPLEWLAAALPPAGRKSPGRHTGFAERDYHEGVNPDGTF